MLKQHEVVDGCSVGDLVDFRIPLRGACRPYLCPTVTNVFNKFSVRFFVRVVVVTERVERHFVEGDEDEDVMEERLVEEELVGALHELVMWRGSSAQVL